MAKRSTSSKQRFLRALKSRRIAGFTLIELLVSIIIGAIIILGLLTLVLDLTDTDRKDASRTETQRDVQLALNYITEDLREAVFVYDQTCLQGNGDPAVDSTKCPGIINHIPASLNSATTIPVLAFWRPDTAPPEIQKLCRDTASSQADLETLVGGKGVPCISGRSYTLVVYGVDTSNSGLWRGRARLIRYKLSQFKTFSTAPTLGSVDSFKMAGYVDPLQAATAASGFWQWPYQPREGTSGGGGGTGYENKQTAAGGRPTETDSAPQVLIDFVDDGRPTSRPTNNVSATNLCPSGMTPTTHRIPAAGPLVPGFMACVRGNTYASQENINQEVFLSLTGHIDGRSGFPPNVNQADVTGRVFPLQTTVVTRGFLEKRSS